MSALLDAYLMLAWVLCIVIAVMLRKDHRRHGCLAVPAIVVFALGWPVILPVAAMLMRRKA